MHSLLSTATFVARLLRVVWWRILHSVSVGIQCMPSWIRRKGLFLHWQITRRLPMAAPSVEESGCRCWRHATTSVVAYVGDQCEQVGDAWPTDVLCEQSRRSLYTIKSNVSDAHQESFSSVIVHVIGEQVLAWVMLVEEFVDVLSILVEKSWAEHWSLRDPEVHCQLSDLSFPEQSLLLLLLR